MGVGKWLLEVGYSSFVRVFGIKSSVISFMSPCCVGFDGCSFLLLWIAAKGAAAAAMTQLG